MQKENYSKETQLASDVEHRAENGTDADELQIRMQRAELRADLRAEPYADRRAVVCANDYAEKMAEMQKHLQKPERQGQGLFTRNAVRGFPC